MNRTPESCACVGEGREKRPCLLHFAAMAAIQQQRTLTHLGIRWTVNRKVAPGGR